MFDYRNKIIRVQCTVIVHNLSAHLTLKGYTVQYRNSQGFKSNVVINFLLRSTNLIKLTDKLFS